MLQLPRALGSSLPSEVCAALNTLTLETYDAVEELILDAVPGLLDAIFDLMDKLNPAVAQVPCRLVWCGVVCRVVLSVSCFVVVAVVVGLCR